MVRQFGKYIGTCKLGIQVAPTLRILSLRRLPAFLRCSLACCLLALSACTSSQALPQEEALRYKKSRFGVSKEFTMKQGIDSVVKKLDLVHSAGIRWRRPNLNWRKYEANPSLYDQAILEANKRGICLAMMIAGWYAVVPGINYQDIKEKRSLEAYKAFVAAVVERYDGDGIDDAPGSPLVRFYQIGNEINGQKHFWRRRDGKPGPASEYVKVLKISYETIKAKNPEIQVILGSLGAEDRGNYLRKLLDAGAGKYFDVLDFHIYHPYKDFYRIIVEEDRVGRFIRLLAKYGIKKPIWVTETAEPSGGKKQFSELTQATNLLKRNVILMAMGVEKVFTHLFNTRPGQKSGREAHRGLLHYDTTPKLAFQAYKVMTRKIDYCQSVSMASHGAAEIATCRFSKDREVYVMWGKSGSTVNLGTGKIRVTDIYGKETIGDAEAVRLTEVPIFVEKVHK